MGSIVTMQHNELLLKRCYLYDYIIQFYFTRIT